MKCLWCLKSYPEVTFKKKAHTIPKSLGGQNFNRNVCDDCNSYFGNRDSNNGKYSIEEALKETFNITRRRFLLDKNPKRKVGEFKSKFFEIKQRNGKYRLVIKQSFKFSREFQTEICRSFKRGLYKMFLEELNRQKGDGYETTYDIIRNFSRFDKGDMPVIYFNRTYGIFLMFNREAETPILFFDRMNYLFSNDKFVEIEFLGHVFGFPISKFSMYDYKSYIIKSLKEKDKYFINPIMIKKLTDVDLALRILDN